MRIFTLIPSFVLVALFLGGLGFEAHAFVFSFGNASTAKDENFRFVQDFLREFQKDHPAIRIDAKGESSYVAAVIDSMMYEGTTDAPDLGVVGIPDSPLAIEAGRLRRLDEILTQKDLAEIRSALRPELDVQFYGTQHDARAYLLPFNRSNVVLYVNRGLLDLPEKRVTWDALFAEIEKRRATDLGLKSKLKLEIPLQDWFMESLFLDERGAPTIENNTVRFGDAASRKVIESIRELKKKGLIELTLTTGRAALDFKSGQAAAILNSMSSYAAIRQNDGGSTQVLLPPRLKTGTLVLGGGDLCVFKTGQTSLTPKRREELRTFIRWFYLGRGAAVWARLVGYHPVTRAALKDAAFRARFKGRPDHERMYFESEKQPRASSYHIERYCNVLKIRKVFQDGLGEIFEAQDVGQATHRVRERLEATVRAPCVAGK